MPKLTKPTIDETEPQATEFFLRDEGIPGFGLRVMPSGRKSFVAQFRAGQRALSPSRPARPSSCPCSMWPEPTGCRRHCHRSSISELDFAH